MNIEHPPSTNLVYAIVDDDGGVNYVGATTSGLTRAFKHFDIANEPYNVRGVVHEKWRWIFKRFATGRPPSIKVLAVLPFSASRRDVLLAERGFIRDIQPVFNRETWAANDESER